MVGSWGEAINSTNGTLYQLRALDWETTGPFQQFPAVIVYHPTNNNGHPFGIFTFVGFIGLFFLFIYSQSPTLVYFLRNFVFREILMRFVTLYFYFPISLFLKVVP